MAWSRASLARLTTKDASALLGKAHEQPPLHPAPTWVGRILAVQMGPADVKPTSLMWATSQGALA